MKKTSFPKLLFLLLGSLLLPFESYAQKEANNWYFGSKAGISFNRNPPQTLLNGQSGTFNGAASMSDANGNLLFYYGGNLISQSNIVFNRNHLPMPNGTGFSGIFGNSLIVPWPGLPSKYFLLGDNINQFPYKKSFSVVDITLNNGLGDVTSVKNIPFADYSSIDVLGIQHRNNRDFWIIHKQEGTNIYSAFLIDINGLNLIPVVSTVGIISSGFFDPLKVSPDGTTIANTKPDFFGPSTIQLLNFDAVTGIISDKGVLPDSTAVGIEFSPDGTKLYCSRAFSLDTVHLVQYDLTAGNAAAIYQSAVQVHQFTRTSLGRVFMQVGPNGKIYFTTDYPNNRFLHVINRPNLKGRACRVTENVIDLDPHNSGQHYSNGFLPTFIQSYFYRPKITMQQTCFGDTAFFALGNNAYVDSVEWNFGDPASGALNTSTLFNPKHFYATAGSYNVQAIVHFNFSSDTLNQTVFIPTTIVKPNLGPDVSLCAGDTIRLNAYQPGASYEWQDSINTDSVFVVTQPGTYWVQVTNGCGTLGDTIVVSPAVPLTLSLPADTVLCPGQQLVLSVNATGGNLLWSDSTTAATFTVTQPGTYWAELSNSCGRWRDSITVNYRPAPNANWLPDSLTLCKQSSYTINGFHPEAIRYKWQDGSANASFTATVSGIYWLEVTTACTTIRDSINLTLIPTPPIELGPDQALCTGEQLTLKVNARGGEIQWQDGSTDTVFTVTKAGTYWAEISNSCGSWRDSVTITEQRCFKAAFLPNIVTPNGDNLNDRFEPKGLEAGAWELEVYNRWGSQIYKNDNYTNQWPDKKLSSGTYYYLLRNKSTGKTHKGWVEVVGN